MLHDLVAALGGALGAPRVVSLTDAELSRGVGGVASAPPTADRAPHARGGGRRGERGGTWTRVTLPAPAAHVYGTIVGALARWPDRGPLRYTLPVDLRRHRPDLPLTVAEAGTTPRR